MKAGSTSSANQYANALLQLAETKGLSNDVLQNLQGINEAMRAEPEMGTFLGLPSINYATKAEFLKKAFGSKIDELTGRLIEILCERRKMNLLPLIQEAYRGLLNEKRGIAAGTLKSADALDNESLEQIKKKLSASLGKQLELEVQQDKSLIGGFVLRLGDQVIDGSLKGRLQAIEKSLLSV